MDFTDDQLSTLRQRLGVDDTADEAAIIATLEAEPNDPAEPGSLSLPEGTVAIDATQLEELQVAARAGQAARAQQQDEERDRLVSAAVADGRIAPVRRDHWVNQLKADPGSAEVLAGLALGLVPVAAVGYTGGPEATEDDDLYESLFGKVSA